KLLRRLRPPRSPYTTLFRPNRLVEPYRPAPAAWPLTLVKAERSLIDRDPALGWDQLAAHGLRTLRCQGDHYTMLTSPDAVTLVADRKSTRLNSSHGSISYAV